MNVIHWEGQDHGEYNIKTSIICNLILHIYIFLET